METILYFFRDSISGIYYVMYAFVCLLLMFSIIGYLFKQKYAKVEIKLNTSQNAYNNSKKEDVKPVIKENSTSMNTSSQSINVLGNKVDQQTEVIKTPILEQTIVNPNVNSQVQQINK